MDAPGLEFGRGQRTQRVNGHYWADPPGATRSDRRTPRRCMDSARRLSEPRNNPVNTIDGSRFVPKSLTLWRHDPAIHRRSLCSDAATSTLSDTRRLRKRPLVRFSCAGEETEFGNGDYCRFRQLALHRDGSRWILYTGHFWDSGWSVLDVTDPARPEFLRFIEGPPGMRTAQIQAAGNLLITGLERDPYERSSAYDPREGGALIWDIGSDPADPRLLGHYRSGGDGTHRNFYDGGRYLYAAVRGSGTLDGGALAVVDVNDPSAPRELSRWSNSIDGRTPFVHGTYIVGDRAYCASEQMTIVDISDRTQPKTVGGFGLGSFSGVVGVHSAVPYSSGRYLVVNGEAHAEGDRYEVTPVVLLDLANESAPRALSTFPVPRPSPQTRVVSYIAKGGRVGPHNQHQHQAQPDLLEPTSLIPMTYFNAGLRIFSIADPYYPAEVGWYVPDDPPRRYGPRPAGALVCHLEDVVVDSRENIYCSDANRGLFILRYDGKLAP